MDLNVSGWRRDMGQKQIGSVELANAKVRMENDGSGWISTAPTVKIGKDKVKIGWRSELTLNGTYLVTLDLPKEDIARLFVFLFGEILDPQEIKKYGMDVDAKGLIAKTLMKMPLGEVLAMFSGTVKPSTPILESEVSMRAFNCLQNEGISTYEELATRSQAEILRIPNMGRKVLNELKESLDARGLSFEGQ